MEDEGFHEIQLNGKQLVFLCMSAAVVLVVAFLLGVLVGRGVRVQKEETTLAAEALVPAPDAAAPGGTGEMATTLPPPSAGGTPPPPTEEETTYRSRLESPEVPAESLKPEKPATSPVSAAPAGGDLAPAPPPATKAEPAASQPAGAGYAVQVAALGGRSSAEAVAKRLVGKGHRAFVVAPGPRGGRMYKVLVGRFKTLQEAEDAKRRLEKEEQFKPWITR